VPEVKEII